MYNTIVEFLYHGFRPYVKQEKLNDYDLDCKKNAKNSLKSVQAFFSKHIDINYYHKNLKEPGDAFLFNYFVVDLDMYGLKQTDTFRSFKSAMRKRLRK